MGGGATRLCEVKDAVRALRAKKSMLAGQGGPNGRSAGSFFVNPVVTPEHHQDILMRASAKGLAASDVPAWSLGGAYKMAAAWLIEQAGFPRGTSRGRVGQSTDHALAITNHGGATTCELLAFAEEIAQAVQREWGVSLAREPQLLGSSSIMTDSGDSEHRS